MDQEDSGYTLTLGIMSWDRLAAFGPKDVSPVAVHSFPGSQDESLYTRNELKIFWDSILISAASRNVLSFFLLHFLSRLKEIPAEMHCLFKELKGQNSFPYYAPRTDFFVDNLILPRYFKCGFLETIGPVAYVFQHCKIYLFLLSTSKFLCRSCGFDNTQLRITQNDWRIARIW